MTPPSPAPEARQIIWNAIAYTHADTPTDDLTDRILAALTAAGLLASPERGAVPDFAVMVADMLNQGVAVGKTWSEIATQISLEAYAIGRRSASAPVVPKARPEVVAFAALMERELRANDHKPGWKSDDPTVLARRVQQEAAELLDAVGNWHGEDYPRDLIAEEAADVANMAMMVADVCGCLPVVPKAEGDSGAGLPIPVTEIIAALEREAANTDTDPRWLAATELRRMTGWETRTLMCRSDNRPSTIAEVKP